MKKIEAMPSEESVASTDSQIDLLTLTGDAKEARQALPDERKPQWKGR